MWKSSLFNLWRSAFMCFACFFLHGAFMYYLSPPPLNLCAVIIYKHIIAFLFSQEFSQPSRVLLLSIFLFKRLWTLHLKKNLGYWFFLIFNKRRINSVTASLAGNFIIDREDYTLMYSILLHLEYLCVHFNFMIHPLKDCCREWIPS